MHPEEWLDLVDENDQVIGKGLRAEIYAAGKGNFRVINVLLRNSKGEFWIPRRAAHKAMFPLGRDFSAAGHVSSGETYEEAFAKEVREEINVDVAKVPWKELGRSSPKEGTAQYMKIFEIVSDETPAYNPDDFVEASWMTAEEIVSKYESGEEYMKDDLPHMIKRFYL